MKAFLCYFFCCRTNTESTMSILPEENRVSDAGSEYGRRKKRVVGYSKSVGRVKWRPALSVISEDGVLHAPPSDCQPNRDVRHMKRSLTTDKKKAMAKSQSTNTRNLYSWRFLLENSSTSMPSPFMFG